MVYISKTVTVQGGYSTAFTEPPDPDANPTTLDAGKQGRVIYVIGNISPTLEGLRITGGDATGLGGNPAGDSGGGVFAISATVMMSNSQVLSNTALLGGGLYFRNSNGTRLTDNLISGNRTARGGSGGGLYVDHSADVVLSGNTVGGNGATHAGGLEFYHSKNTTLVGNLISNNTARNTGNPGTILGGGLYIGSGSNVTMMSNTIRSNGATQGGGLCVGSGSMLHTTIARNAGGGGSGVHVISYDGHYSTVALTNTMLVGHTVGITIAAGSTATLNGVLWCSNATN